LFSLIFHGWTALAKSQTSYVFRRLRLSVIVYQSVDCAAVTSEPW
jgi:hypothetical protein